MNKLKVDNENLKPLVTIITPSFQTANYLRQTYESVLNQTFTNWEWLIIDDCSTDDSYRLAKELSDCDSRIKVYKTDTNSGTAAARNIGLKHANGKYITFLDSDDMLDDNYLEFQIKFMKENGPLISASYRRKAEHTCTDFIVPKSTDYKTALKGNPLSCLTTMYDKSVIGEVYFRENIKKAEDYVFWLDILKKGYVAKGNQQVLATYIIHAGSKSSNKLKLIKHMYYVYRKTQNLNVIYSWFCVIRWAFYGLKKYRNVR